MSTKINSEQVEFDRLNALFLAKGEFSPQEHITFRDMLLARWETSKSELEIAKETEMNQRKAFVAFAFDPTKESGTETIDLANGYKAKAVKKINYNVDQEKVNDALDKLENLSPEGKFIAERLIKWTAALSVTEYKDLKPEYKKIIDEAITTTEGAPTLAIVEPKGTKKL